MQQQQSDPRTAPRQSLYGGLLQVTLVLAPAVLILLVGLALYLVRLETQTKNVPAVAVLVPPFSNQAFAAQPEARLVLAGSQLYDTFVVNPWDHASMPLSTDETQVLQQLTHAASGVQFATTVQMVSSSKEPSEAGAWYDTWLQARDWCPVARGVPAPGNSFVAYKHDDRTIFTVTLWRLPWPLPFAASLPAGSLTFVLTQYDVLAKPIETQPCV